MTDTTAVRTRKALTDFAGGVAAALFFVIEFLPVGILFGTMSVDAGISPGATAGMSALVFAGASQFLALTLLNTGATAGTVILGTFIINLRHILMSSYIASAVNNYGALQRIFTGATVTDEGFALTSQQVATKGDNISGWYVLGVNVSLYLQWQLSTLAGIFLGNAIPGMQDMGIEAVLYALFISIVVLSVSRRSDISVALVAAALALILTLAGYTSSAVVTASLLASFLGLGVYKWTGKSG